MEIRALVEGQFLAKRVHAQKLGYKISECSQCHVHCRISLLLSLSYSSFYRLIIFFQSIMVLRLDLSVSKRNSGKLYSSASTLNETTFTLHLLFYLSIVVLVLPFFKEFTQCPTFTFLCHILFIFPPLLWWSRNHSEGYYFTRREACRHTAGETHTLIKVWSGAERRVFSPSLREIALNAAQLAHSLSLMLLELFKMQSHLLCLTSSPKYTAGQQLIVSNLGTSLWN